MFETFLNAVAENQTAATLIVMTSSVIILLMCLKPLAYWAVAKTQTKKDDEIVNGLYGAIEKHKGEVEAIHKVAKKVQEKQCKKSS